MILVTVTPDVCSAMVVPLALRAPPLKVPVPVLLAVKVISSVPILIHLIFEPLRSERTFTNI